MSTSASTLSLRVSSKGVSDPVIRECISLVNTFYVLGTPEARETKERKAERLEARLAAWLAYANMLARDTSMLKPPPMMTKPATVPNSELLIWTAVENVRKRGHKAKATNIEIATDFQEWRMEMFRFEARCRNNLKCVIEAVYHVELIPDEDAHEPARRLREFVAARYEVTLPQPLPENAFERDRLATILTTYTEDFPMWMRVMSRPAGCFPGADAAAEEDEKEPK